MKSVLKINLIANLQLLITVSSVSILVIIGGFFIYKYIANRTLKSKEVTLTAIASQKSKQISTWFLDELNDIHIIATGFNLIEEVKKTLKSNSSDDEATLSKWLRQIKAEHDYNDVIIVLSDEKNIVWSDNSSGSLNEAEFRAVEIARKKNTSLHTDLFKIKSDGSENRFIAFICTIKDVDGDVLATLIGRHDFTKTVLPKIEEWPTPSKTAESFLFKAENDSIFYLNELKHNNYTGTDIRIHINNKDLLASQAVSGKLGLVTGKDYRNKNVIGVVSKITGTPWYLISKIDKSEMYQGINLIAFVVSGIMILFICIIALYIINIFNQRQLSILNELNNRDKEFWQQEKKFEVVLNSLGEGVIVTDLDAKVQFMNGHAESLTGWSLSNAKNRNLEEIYSVKSEETGEIVNSIKEKVIEKGIVKELANHTLLVSKSGIEIPVHDIAAPIFDSNGLLAGIVVTFQDETETRTKNHQIRESERNLREFFENDISGDYAVNAEGILMRCNPAFVRILGYNSVDELIGRNILEFYKNPIDREGFVMKLQQTNILNDFEVKLKHKDGLEIICKENVVGIFNESGQLVKYFGYLFDITQQKNAEDKLMHREQLLSSVLETQTELIARYTPDTVISFVNKAYCNFFGKSEIELVGKKYLQFMPENEWNLERARIQQLTKKNSSITSISNAVKSDGTKCVLQWTDTAIFNEHDEIVEIQAFGIDITEKIEADRELLFQFKMNELLRRIAADYIRIPIHEVGAYIEMSLGEIGKFIKADRVYIFDYDWHMHSCSNTFEWCSGEAEPQIENLQNIPLESIPHWWNPHKQGLPLIIDDVLSLDKTDPVRHILEPQKIKSIITIPIMDKENCLGFVGLDYVSDYYRPSKKEQDVLFVFADVLASIDRQVMMNMELKRAKEMAEASDNLKTAFINNISHEVRTPLNGILGFGQFLVESELSEEERMEYYGLVEKSSVRLMNTITDYMDMAMLFSGNMKVNKKEFSLNSVIKDLIKDAEKSCQDKNLIFKTEISYESNDIVINNDPELLQKIFEKLIDNAIKFTRVGSVTFGYRVNINQIEFFVKDTGIGIDNSKLDLIFEMFKQADVSLTRAHEGSGLGLTIAKGLITLLGGNIQVVSEKGRGSEFSLNIPLNEIGNYKSEILIDAAKSILQHNPKILIAEDDELNFEYLSVLLKSNGYNCLRVANGIEAVDFCRANQDVSLVLMDIKMPLMHGDEATKQIRKFNADIPIIATTAFAQSGDEHRFLEAGCTDYITKPIKKDKLLTLLNKYIK